MAETETAGARETLYPSSFYFYQTPILIDYAARLAGVSVPKRPFTYLDLGCGDGFTCILLAAMHPHCRFVGIDYNPGHVARGNAIAAAGGIENVRLVEGAFENWRDLDLPECDYVTMHGVWTWIGEAARAHCIDIIREKLRPGGFVYCGYNAYPGWAAIAPLRQYFLDYTEGMGPDAVANVAATLKHLQELKAKGAEFFQKNTTAAGFLDDMAKFDIRYVVHEIYPPEWGPVPFSSVLRAMRGAGLDFAASIDLAKNFPRWSVRPEFLPGLLKEKDVARAELWRDYANNTYFRRDLFVKGSIERGAVEMGGVPFGAKVPSRELQRTLALPSGAKFQLEGERFDALRRAFDKGTRTLEQLAAEPGLQLLPRTELAEGLQLLTFGMEVGPFLGEAAAPAAPPQDWSVPSRINRHLLAEPVGPEGFALLASPVAGSAVVMQRGDALVVEAVAAVGPDKAAEWAWGRIADRGPYLVRKGAPAKDRARHMTAFAETRQALQERLSKWVELGLIAPR